MISERDGRLYVTGAMTQQTAAQLKLEGDRFVAAGRRIVDLAEVTHVDSSALAVVLAWMRAAHDSGSLLEVIEAPLAFKSLASLYGVDEILFPSQAENRE